MNFCWDTYDVLSLHIKKKKKISCLRAGRENPIVSKSKLSIWGQLTISSLCVEHKKAPKKNLKHI